MRSEGLDSTVTFTHRTPRHHWTEDADRFLELSETGKIYGYGKARAARRARGYIVDDDLELTTSRPSLKGERMEQLKGEFSATVRTDLISLGDEEVPPHLSWRCSVNGSPTQQQPHQSTTSPPSFDSSEISHSPTWRIGGGL